jgi:anti-sigma factor RsiW
MRCPTGTRESEERMLGYASGTLEPREARAFEAHLAACGECREAAAEQRRVSQSLDLWAAPPVSADFDRRLMARIEAEVSWWDVMVRPFRGMGVLRVGPVAATAVLLLMAGFLLQRPDAILAPGIPETAQVEAVPPDQAESALVDMDTIREFSSMFRADAGTPRM